MQNYLPRKHGKILCGLFDCAKNILAPTEIDVGNKPQVLAGAEILSKADYAIPVFLKLKANAWEFVGNYKCYRYSTSPEDLFPANPLRRPDAVGVLFLERVYTEPSDAGEELLVQEGGKHLKSHLVRERDPSLVAAKKRLVKKLYGYLSCECCGLSSKSFPRKLGDSCFEAHHKNPISGMKEDSNTRLDDLAILCANCHRMAHSTVPLISIGDLAGKLSESK